MRTFIKPPPITLVLVFSYALLTLLTACPTTALPPKKPVVPASRPTPQLVVGQPVTHSIKAERDFFVPIRGEVLAYREHKAAIYTQTVRKRALKVKKRKLGREFKRWARVVTRARIRDLAAFNKAYTLHKKVLGVQISRRVFERIRRSSRRRLGSAFTAMLRHISDAYVVEARGVLEKKVETKEAIVRPARGKKGREKKITLAEIKDLGDLKKELALLAKKHGKKLSPQVQGDLVRIIGENLAPTLTLDRARLKKAWVVAQRKVETKPLRFIKGQIVVKKGETLTGEQRGIITTMRALRCEPCAAGAGQCSGGLLPRLRLGGRILRPLKATRSFHVPVDAELKHAVREQALDAVPRVFVLDPEIARSRIKKLGFVLDLASISEGDERWQKLQDGLENELQTKILGQVLDPFVALPFKQLRSTLLALYRSAQSGPITAAAPVPVTEPCILRSKAKAKEEMLKRCPILPLARLRLDLPLRAGRTIGLLAKMPDNTQKAMIELVQQLLVPNTTFDVAETKRRREKAAAAAKPEERFYRKGEVVFPPKRGLTRVDRHTLKRMFSLRCTPVARP
ncbi:MAG: hypothetical protein JRH20_32685 [Deltaproteobacteria bacterium]|nr:hypothetical protein [Deltaproteobacteria bacterium]